VRNFTMIPADVDMTTAKTSPSKVDGVTTPAPAASVDPSEALAADLRRSLALLERSVAAKDLRLVARMLRSPGPMRPRLNPSILAKTVSCYVPASYPHREAVLAALTAVPDDPAAMQVETIEMLEKPAKADGDAISESALSALDKPAPTETPEVSAYLHLLSVLVLLDAKRGEDAVAISSSLIDSLGSFNRRTLDEINARAFFYYARSIELYGKLSSIRAGLLAAYRTAVLHHDAASQAVLLNLLLRNYIAYNLYDQADKLISRAPFPETRSNNQLSRNLYFTGRIKAIQLDYSEALWNLQQAQRKAPQSSALGFRTTVQKFMVIVQLLTGEIPDRAVFRQPNMKAALMPYLLITKAVRVGDLAAFTEVTETHSALFTKDGTSSLITRLRHNVIKTGLRKLSTAYSRISLAEISSRLYLDGAVNAEGVVAKAIHDGVIDAVVDHKQGFVRSNENMDVYSTTEPTEAYHTRIQFCLGVHNQAVRAMRFPDNKEDEETPDQRLERLKEQEDLVATLDEEDDEDDMGMY
jgi:26S proteasome regulatory subunit N3